MFEGLVCPVSAAVSLGQTSGCGHGVTLLNQVQYCDATAAVLHEVLCSVVYTYEDMIIRIVNK